jgi:hypothetical protein
MHQYSKEVRKVPTNIKKKCITFIVLLFYFLTLASLCYAEKVRTVEGLIEEVSKDSIKVRGKYYNISDAPLKNASGKTVSKDQLKVGKKVEIFFLNDRIKTILIYEDMVE